MYESLTNFLVLFKEHSVEQAGEGEYRFVLDLILLIYAYYMLCTSLLKDSTDELRVAGGDEHEFELSLVLPDHFLELSRADELTATFVILEQKKVALIFVLLMELLSQAHVIYQTMATEVKAQGLLSQYFRQTLRCALALCKIDLDLSC